MTVRSYGLLVMLGFVAGIWLAAGQAKRRGLPSDLAIDLGLFSLVGGMVFARLLFAASITPDVSLSRRWTMPGRRESLTSARWG